MPETPVRLAQPERARVERALSTFDLWEAAVEAVRARLGLLVLIVVTVTTTALLLRANAPSYEATAQLVFTPGNVIQTIFREPRDAPSPDPAQLTSDPVLQLTGSRIHPRDRIVGTDELRGRLSVVQTGNPRTVRLVARSMNSQDALDLVNAWAASFIDYRNSQLGRAVEAARDEVEARARQLSRSASSAQQRDIVRQQLAVAGAGAITPDVQVVQSGTPVGFTGRPAPTTLVLGAMVGLFLVVLLGWADRRLRTPRMVESVTGLPVIAEVTAPSGANSPEAPVPVEGIERLLAELYLDGGREQSWSILLTDTGGDGWRIGLALAAALGSASRQAILVTDASTFDGPGDTSVKPLEGVVSGEVELEQAVTVVEMDGFGVAPVAVAVLSGPTQARLDFAGDRWVAMHERARSNYDVVIYVLSHQRLTPTAALATTDVATWLLVARLGEVTGQLLDRVLRPMVGRPLSPSGVVAVRTDNDGSTGVARVGRGENGRGGTSVPGAEPLQPPTR